MGIDRVADRLETEEIQPLWAEHQKVLAAGGVAVQFIAQVWLADQAVAIPAGEAVVQPSFGQCVAVVEVPFGGQILQLAWQTCLIAQPDLRGPGLQACMGRAWQVRVQAQAVPHGVAVQMSGGQFDTQFAIVQGVAQVRAVGEWLLAVELQTDLLCGVLNDRP